MISKKEAEKMVLSTVIQSDVVAVPLEKSYGRILRENWIADRDMPPYDRVTMDGIAINYAGSQGKEKLPVEGVAAAGAQRQKLVSLAACMEVMTGCILPENCDTVIRYEDVTIDNGAAIINIAYKNHKNVHYQGEDRKQGDLLVKEFTKIDAAEIGVGASIGKATVKVSRRPRVVIISTGDELVAIRDNPLPHQIRKSNVFRIGATLSAQGVKSDTLHILDDFKETKKKIGECLDSYDAIILSGGVSKGKFDYVPQVLEELGVEKKFHRVAQRPGKPFWFGTYQDKAVVFALPGNPVSSFMCTHVYFLPWLAKQQGRAIPEQQAILAADYVFKPSLTYLLQVQLHNEDGCLYAYPVTGRGSGDFANLLDADAFLELPEEKSEFKKGEVFRFYPFRN